MCSIGLCSAVRCIVQYGVFCFELRCMTVQETDRCTFGSMIMIRRPSVVVLYNYISTLFMLFLTSLPHTLIHSHTHTHRL
jgi:hypothetical protein